MSKITLRGPKDKVKSILETYSLSFKPISKIILRGPKDKVKSILDISCYVRFRRLVFQIILVLSSPMSRVTLLGPQD